MRAPTSREPHEYFAQRERHVGDPVRAVKQAAFCMKELENAYP